MGALAPLSSWIPEDDLLLKNAVEAGASLESLAKGAVQFSRKFTVRELQERWHSLLYDPVVSEEAAFHMIEFELSATTLPSKFSRVGNSRDNNHVSGKRKVESVRNCYYALSKRICNEPFNPLDLTFLMTINDENYMGNEHCILGDTVSDQFGLQESNMDIMHDDFPEIRDDINTNGFPAQFHNPVQESYSVEQDNVHTEMLQICEGNIFQAADGTLNEEYRRPEDLPENADQVNGYSKFGGENDFSSPIIRCNVPFQNLEYSSPLPEMPIWRTVECVSLPCIPLDMHTGDTYSLPDDGDTISLSEFHMHGDAKLELEIPSENIKNLTGSTEVYLAELSNSLLNFTNEEELLFTDDGEDVIDKSYYDDGLSSPVDASQDHMVDIAQRDVNLDCLKDQTGGSHGGIDQDERLRLSNDMVVDSDIHFLATASGSGIQVPEMSGEVILCTLNTEDPEIPCNEPPTHSKIIRSQLIPETGSLHPVDDNAFKDASAEEPRLAKMKEETPEVVTMNHLSHAVVGCLMQKSAVGLAGQKSCQSNASDVKLDLDVPPQIQQYQVSDANLGSIDIAESEYVANDHMSDREEPSIESDDDVPSFSDIEAMILDMDLDPENQDLYSSEEVSRYQKEDTKRLIVRLEQGAYSYMQGAIGSQGAFAVLYGQHSKHYIKKPEVLLGRGTEDVVVDIDLWREGRGNKVSRRQATMKLDKHGSFYLRNLGKCPILVNDKEIFHGQSLNLPSSCLIEIRGMPFIFETNQTYVKQYLDSIMQQNKLTGINFEELD